jgi:hypothetical protein
MSDQRGSLYVVFQAKLRIFKRLCSGYDILKNQETTSRKRKNRRMEPGELESFRLAGSLYLSLFFDLASDFTFLFYFL